MGTKLLSASRRFEAAAASSGSSGGIDVTSGAIAHNKGATYTTLIASTAFDAEAVRLVVMIGTGTADALVDLAVGAALSEQIIVNNALCSRGTQGPVMATLLFPVRIPAGSRLSARSQCTTGARVTSIWAQLISAGSLGPHATERIETLGAATADSGGTSIDPGGTANTKGAWVELSASTSFDYQGFALGIGSQNNGAPGTFAWLVDVGIGGAGSEQVVIPNLILRDRGGISGSHEWFDCPIPGGSRVAGRAQCNGTDATDRLFDIALYGAG